MARLETSAHFAGGAAKHELGLVLRRFDAPEPDGPPFVMVHGMGVSSTYFEPLADELADDGAVWLVDLPGYGASPKPGRTVTLDDHVSALVDALADAGIENPVLIGHSWGCQVVTLLADRHPDVSDRLVLLSPTINAARRSVWMQFVDLLRTGLVEPPSATAFAVYSYVLRRRLGYYLSQLPQMIGDPIEARLPRISAQTLVIRGEKDRIVPARWAEQVAGLLSHARLITVPGAHVVMRTAPREIAELVKDLAQ